MRARTLSELYVGIDCVGEQENILHHRGNAFAKLAQCQIADRNTVEPYFTLPHIVKPLQERDDRGFPGTGRPHNTDGFARRQVKGNIL